MSRGVTFAATVLFLSAIKKRRSCYSDYRQNITSVSSTRLFSHRFFFDFPPPRPRLRCVSIVVTNKTQKITIWRFSFLRLISVNHEMLLKR